MTVLVAYATCHGSTRGVAERLGSRLVSKGLDTDVRAVSDVGDVTAYAAAVLGSAVHGGKWLPEAVAFVRRWGPTLHGRPIWLFSVSTLGDEEAMFNSAIAKRLRAMRKETPELLELRRIVAPVEHRNFAGAIAASDWPLTGRLFFKAVGGRYGDHRNWSAIDAWGDRIAARVVALADAGEATA